MLQYRERRTWLVRLQIKEKVRHCYVKYQVLIIRDFLGHVVSTHFQSRYQV